MLDIASLLPIERATVGASPWWEGVQRRYEVVGRHAPAQLRSIMRALEQRLETTTWRFGAWHGDFTPWNAQWVDGRLHVWDWERAGGPVPLGFDPVHAEFQIASLRDHLGAADAAARVTRTHGSLLRELGVPRDEHALLVDCYQLELCFRFLDACRGGSIGTLQLMVADIVEALSGRVNPDREP